MYKAKKHGIILLFLLANSLLFAQLKFADSKTINEFLRTKTYIVLEDIMFSDFNTAINEAAKKHWKITPYEIINLKKYEQLSKSPKHSFLIVSIGEITGLKTSFSFNLLNLLMGHPSGNINKMKEIIIIPLSYYSEEGDEEEYAYKLSGILNAFQYYVLNHTNEDWKKWINENKKDLKNKELWLTKNDISSSIHTTEEIQNLYPYALKIVSEKEIEEAIDKKLPQVAFVHKVGKDINQHAYCLKTIIACSDGKVLYLSYDKITKQEPAGMLIKDFKTLID